MEIRTLNTFLRVAALQNFTQAGKELGYSQSNISAQISQLEREIGAPLFNRIGRGVTLTQYGEELLPYAQRIVSTALEMESFTKSEAMMGGTVRIGMVDSLSELLLEDAFLKYHRRFPKVQMELTLGASAGLKDYLSDGRLDTACLIDDPLPAAEWTVWDAVEIPIVLVCSPSHPLATQRKVPLKALSGQKLILMENNAAYSMRFQSAMAGQHLDCRPFLKLESADTARRLVERDSFLSFLPLYTVRTSIHSGRLCALETEDCQLTQFVQLVLHRSKVLTPQIEGFLEELRYTLAGALSYRLSNSPAGNLK